MFGLQKYRIFRCKVTCRGNLAIPASLQLEATQHTPGYLKGHQICFWASNQAQLHRTVQVCCIRSQNQFEEQIPQVLCFTWLLCQIWSLKCNVTSLSKPEIKTGFQPGRVCKNFCLCIFNVTLCVFLLFPQSNCFSSFWLPQAVDGEAFQEIQQGAMTS